MSSIMRWRNGLMGLSVMAITPVSHEVSEPHDLETGRAILFIPTSNPPRACCPLGVVFVRAGRAEIGQEAVAHELGGEAVVARNRSRTDILISTDDLTHVLGIKPRRH